ncbi:MAG TPA: DUF4249 domain-containing protein [Mucilaginibacter sp.]|nr:DUF4249 domain-containing protein [Mucilaginibacter sp.]
MKIPASLLVISCLLLVILSCRKPYNPIIVLSNQNYLVVDGMINSGSDSTIIYLSRTVKLSSPSFRNYEQGARVVIESDKNDVFALQEIKAGKYVVTNLNLPTDRNYRLHIFTSDNREYISDYVENKITPPIDSVYAIPLVTGVQFAVSSHDNSNKTRYYRWDYTESWSYTVGGENPSLLIYKNGDVAPRNPDSLVSLCYKYPAHSSAIFLGNSDKLAQDVINKYPLGYVDGSTGKITKTYALTVRQYALTSEAYKYWTLLKTNSEHLGTITDPQPTSSITNIHAVNNPGEPVIGYISFSTVTIKTIFLMGRTLPFAVNQHAGDTVECAGGVIYLKPLSSFPYRLRQTFASGDTLLLSVVTDSGKTTGYRYTNAICADCRLRGGTTTKPTYWPFGF